MITVNHLSKKYINPDGSVKEQQEGIYADGLVRVIDTMVEKTDDYASRVRETYGM